jgi:peptidoglycan hydrolase-like protein with peptidoglycan-binding domain
MSDYYSSHKIVFDFQTTMANAQVEAVAKKANISPAEVRNRGYKGIGIDGFIGPETFEILDESGFKELRRNMGPFKEAWGIQLAELEKQEIASAKLRQEQQKENNEFKTLAAGAENIGPGAKGEHVKALKAWLNTTLADGEKLPLDDVYGDAQGPTATAVAKFQLAIQTALLKKGETPESLQAKGIPAVDVTGVFDKATFHYAQYTPTPVQAVLPSLRQYKEAEEAQVTAKQERFKQVAKKTAPLVRGADSPFIAKVQQQINNYRESVGLPIIGVDRGVFGPDTQAALDDYKKFLAEAYIAAAERAGRPLPDMAPVLAEKGVGPLTLEMMEKVGFNPALPAIARA